MLEREFKYFLDNKEGLSQKYNGKFLVIKEEKIIGVYDTEKEAYDNAIKNNELGTFLIQECSTSDSAFIQNFHSRVLF
jgi:hypothetical protein